MDHKSWIARGEKKRRNKRVEPKRWNTRAATFEIYVVGVYCGRTSVPKF